MRKYIPILELLLAMKAKIEAMSAHARVPWPYTDHLGPKVTRPGWIGPKSYMLLNISIG
jgi:hypothetical protein